MVEIASVASSNTDSGRWTSRLLYSVSSPGGISSPREIGICESLPQRSALSSEERQLKEPRTVDEFKRFLDDCDRQTRSEPLVSTQAAKRAFSHLERLDVSPYVRRKLHMRSAGVLGSALVSLGQIEEAGIILEAEKQKSPSKAERASLAIRLVRYYSEKLDWEQASSEAELAVDYFRKHRPRYESDLRSLSGALVARGNLAFLAFYVGAKIPNNVCPAHRAERDYRSALRHATPNTEYCALAASGNLCKLALQLWWETGDYKIRPSAIAKEMARICKILTKRGIKFRSRPHANARWVYGLAVAEAFGGLNRAAEFKLERAYHDLLDLGAMTDAASLALDLCYCYLRENRWEDMLTTIATLIQHPLAAKLPADWLQALLAWKAAIERREIQNAISSTFLLIRGFPVSVQPAQREHIPRSRHGDRDDTLGF